MGNFNGEGSDNSYTNNHQNYDDDDDDGDDDDCLMCQ